MRDVGRSGAVLEILPKTVVTGEGRLPEGETARLRKGLLEDNPGETCLPESVAMKVLSVIGRRVAKAGDRFRRDMVMMQQERMKGNDKTEIAVVACF